jgi:hypothetical protein
MCVTSLGSSRELGRHGGTSFRSRANTWRRQVPAQRHPLDTRQLILAHRTGLALAVGQLGDPGRSDALAAVLSLPEDAALAELRHAQGKGRARLGPKGPRT